MLDDDLARKIPFFFFFERGNPRCFRSNLSSTFLQRYRGDRGSRDRRGEGKDGCVSAASYANPSRGVVGL